MKMITVICEQCGKEFEKTKKSYGESIRKHFKFLCSNECRIENRKRIKVKCENCGCELERLDSEYEESKTKNFFCTKSCAATFNNKIYIKRKTDDNYNKEKQKYTRTPNLIKIICDGCGQEFEREKRNYQDSIRHGWKSYCSKECRLKSKKCIEFNNCLYCGKKVNGYNYKFCSLKCNVEYNWKCKIEKAEETGYAPTLQFTAKTLMLKIKGNKCEICGTNEWNGNFIALEMHHKDGNHDNNQIENLELLCPNCHSQTGNYKNKDRSKMDG